MTHAPVNLLLPMFADALEMLALTRASFHRYDPGPAETAIGLGRSIHKRERELTEQLIAAPPEIDGFRFLPSIWSGSVMRSRACFAACARWTPKGWPSPRAESERSSSSSIGASRCSSARGIWP